MKVKVLREFYGDQGNARTGDELVVSKTTGNELKARGLVEILDDADDEAIEQEATEVAAEKSAEAPANKAQAKPGNKSASKSETK